MKKAIDLALAMILVAGSTVGLATAKGHASQQASETIALARPLLQGRIVTDYGSRMNPVYKREYFHPGILYYAEEGTPVLASADGTVIFAATEYPLEPNRGTVVIIQHSNTIKTLYGSLGSISVERGQEVKAGDVIGAVGRTTSSRAYHLYFEVLETKNPHEFLR